MQYTILLFQYIVKYSQVLYNVTLPFPVSHQKSTSTQEKLALIRTVSRSSCGWPGRASWPLCHPSGSLGKEVERSGTWTPSSKVVHRPMPWVEKTIVCCGCHKLMWRLWNYIFNWTHKLREFGVRRLDLFYDKNANLKTKAPNTDICYFSPVGRVKRSAVSVGLF